LQARAPGAFDVISHHTQTIAEAIERRTNHRGVAVVIEHVGEATWPKSIRAPARGGRPVTCRATTGGHGALDRQRRLQQPGQFGRIVLEMS
jgi:NADPH:quinone reductase-like Zn-dependent oxidoreductase